MFNMRFAIGSAVCSVFAVSAVNTADRMRFIIFDDMPVTDGSPYSEASHARGQASRGEPIESAVDQNASLEEPLATSDGPSFSDARGKERSIGERRVVGARR